MQNKDWILIDTETTGLTSPIFVVELAAQRMRGWEPLGPSFRRLLNQNTDIPSEASRVHGYTREILERDGEPALEVYRQFAQYADGLPLVSYNLKYDLEDVLKPEWRRLSIQPIGSTGFCALKLSQRLLDPVPAGNCKLQTLRQYYRLPERGAHTALGDVETVADLLGRVLRPIAERSGLATWSDVCAYTNAVWFPSRIAFGKFKGRDYRDARDDEDLRGWLTWLAASENARSAQMGKWYLSQIDTLNLGEASARTPIDVGDDSVVKKVNAAVNSAEHSVIEFCHPEIEELRKLIAFARSRLAELEAHYTKDRRAVDLVQATIFNLVREHYQAHDAIKLIVSYRQKYLNTLLQDGEEEAEQVADKYENAKQQSASDYDQAAETAANQTTLSDKAYGELQSIWKKLVRLFHPDRFMRQREKRAAFENLTSVINKARDEGDIDLLREIAADPEAFILRQGWANLDFADEVDIKSMRKLYAMLQVEIVNTIESLNMLHESPEYELYILSEKQPGLLQDVANDKIKAITAEIAQLEAEATRLKQEIDQLVGGSKI